MTYENYKIGCKEKGYRPSMNLKQFNEMMGIDSEVVIPPLTIRHKNQRPKDCSLKTYNDAQK